MAKLTKLLQGTTAAIAFGLIAPAAAVPQTRPTLNLNGAPGLIDMPSGEMAPDGELSVTHSRFGPIGRTTLSFQITPWLQGSFRYSSVKGLQLAGIRADQTYLDRGFDLRVRLMQESRYMPSVTVGLQDFVGTGVFSSEYIAATKTFGDRVKVTAGIGWGRMGTENPIGAPFGPRPRVIGAKNPEFGFNRLFRGPAAPFGGIEWQVNDRLGIKVEYSSDDYGLESGPPHNILRRRSPLNFGVEYQASDSLRLGAYFINGTDIGFGAQLALNPKRRPTESVLGPAPRPVALRPDRRFNPGDWSDEWTRQSDAPQILTGNLQRYLNEDGLVVESLTVTGNRAHLRLRENRFDAPAQAIGRAARALAATMPASVEVFEIVPMARGVAASQVTLRRSDLESLEFAAGNDALLRARTTITDAGSLPAGAIRGEDLYPKFRWALLPYSRFRLFGYTDQVRADVGLRLAASYDIAPGLVLSGSITKRLVGNLDKPTTPSNSVLPRVRSEVDLYDRNGDPALETLTLAWYGKMAPDVYTRVTAGYLERMFGGVSAEVLWKPANSRLALGAEVNYVKQRDFDQRLGFRNYSVATGHVSAYYDAGGGYQLQLDVGRYLAGDVGATVSVDREFANGWKVGAFATKTNVSAAQFGNGSFDKGIRVTVPISWVTGRPVKTTYSTTIRPFTRDGGARLDVAGRLYESVRPLHAKRIDDQWGRFWR